MKMRDYRFPGFLKNLATIALVATVAVGCGKSNKSGGSTTPTTVSTLPGGGVYPPGGVPGMNGMQLPPNYMDIVRQENPCINGMQRTPVQFALQGINVNAGAIYLGVSSFGDIAVVSNSNAGPLMQLEICGRPGASGQGQMMQNPVINNSQYCPVGEITAADVILQGQVPMQIKFAPIHIPGYRMSGLCNQMYY
jgi:hypothetical protein